MTNKQVDVLSSENKAIQNREEELKMANKEVVEKLEVFMETLDEVIDELYDMDSHPSNTNGLTTALLTIDRVKDSLVEGDGITYTFQRFKEFILRKDGVQPEDIIFFEHPDEFYTVAYYVDGSPIQERYSRIEETRSFQMFSQRAFIQ